MSGGAPEGVDLRLAVPAAAAWTVAALTLGMPSLPGPVAALAILGAVGTSILLLLRGSRGATPRPASGAALLGIALIGIGLVCGSAAWQSAARHPEALQEAVESSRQVEAVVEFTGLGAGGPAAAELRELVQAPGVLPGLSVPVMVFGGPEGTEPGDLVRVRGTVTATEPGGRTAYLLFARSSEAIAPPGGMLAATSALRSGFREVATALPGTGGQLLPGLALGDTRAVQKHLDEAMKATSLSHLTAVSGSNCAVVVGLVMLCGRALRWRRSLRVGASLAVLAGFVVLVTPDASVLRAAAMAAVVLLAALRGRLSGGVPALAGAVLILLVIDPWFARDYGFALSVLATAGLLLLARPLAARLERWLPPWLAVVIAVPLAAQLACQPVLILLQPSIPVYGVLANLLCQLAAPLATVLGLIACLLIPAVPPLGHAITALAWLPASWIAGVAETVSGFPLARAPWFEGALGVAALLVPTLLLIGWALRPRRSRLVALAAVLVIYLGALAGLGIGSRLGIPSDWQFAVCPVGQGDALVLRSEGRTAVIDTGPDAVLLQECLERLGVGRIELLVLTHFDLDHVGGSEALLGRVDTVLRGPAGSVTDESLIRRFRDAGAEAVEARAGLSGSLGGLDWRVLWPPDPPATTPAGNDASVVMLVEPGAGCSACLSGLFLGDLGATAQLRLIGHAHPPRVQLVKVSHHGSADQAEELYRRVGAPLAVIGVGENRYGHPATSLLGMLSELGSTIARTDRDGLILVSATEDGQLRLWREFGSGAGSEAAPDRDR